MAVYELGPLGVVIDVTHSASDTGGAFTEFEVSGRPKAFLAQPHVHRTQTERHEVLLGAMRLVISGRKHVLHAGDAMEVPAGAVHAQLPGGEGVGRVRVRLTPAGDEEAFFARLAELCANGGINRFGFPRPVAGAELVRDYGDGAHAARPSLATQKKLAGAILKLASPEYLFTDEWDVAAPREAVFQALSDARSYPDWWRPVYIGVEAEGEPALGKESRQHFKGRLPYHLHTRSRIVELDPPRVVAGEVDGDLRGHGVWTLTENADGGTHVRFDWRVHADRALLRVLTPVLRPAFRWNHNWAIARAIEGLEPYAQQLARV